MNEFPRSPRPARRPRRVWARLGTAALLPLLVNGCGTDPSLQGTAPAEGDPALIALLEPLRQKHDLPALGAAVVSSRGLETLAVTGYRRRGDPTPVTTNDLWHLGSNTKAMTAALAGRLVERGVVSWESTPAALFPELAETFHPDFRAVTLRDLLAHRGGLAANVNWRALAREGSVVEQRRRAVREALSASPAHPPRRQAHYSNLGYVIAGALLERAAGETWEALLRSEVFAPLGMTRAGLGGVGTPGQLDQPWGHQRGGRPAAVNGPEADNPPVLGPAGRVHAPLADWARFVADQLRGLRGEAGLLRPETYRTLASPLGEGEHALGWVVVERAWANGRALNHCGCNTWFFANVWLAPARDRAVLVVANQGEDAFAATDAVVAALVQSGFAPPPTAAPDAKAGP